MGLTDWIFGKAPTADWVASPLLKLEYDFDRQAFCGVPIRSNFEQLSGLGPAEDPKQAREGSLLYFSRGFDVTIEGDRFMDLELHWQDDFTNRWPTPFPGRCVRGGATLPLSAATTEAQLVEWFGPPTRRDHDDEDDETILSYDRGRHTEEFELRAGTLASYCLIAEE
jgi:hypothetical protein